MRSNTFTTSWRFHAEFLFLRGKTVTEATEDVLRVQLPHLKELMSAGKLRVDNIDVFCEQGVFDLDSTRSILQAGKDMGLNVNFHGDELHAMNSAEVLLASHPQISFKDVAGDNAVFNVTPKWI